MALVRIFENGLLIGEDGVPEPALKTIYTKAQFLDKIPKNIRKQIRAEEIAGNADILDWVFIVNAMDKVDLNELPAGFVDGLDEMVANPNISLNQSQVDNFLER